MRVIITIADIIKSFKAELNDLKHCLDTKNKLDDREVATLLELFEDIKTLKRLAIYRDRLSGMSGKEVAMRYGVTPPRVTQIVNEMEKLMEGYRG